MLLIKNGVVDGVLECKQQDRVRVKEIIMFRWLFEFRFIDVGVTSLILNISERVAYRFLSKLEDRGLIKSKKAVLRVKAERLFYMSNKGYDEWILMDDDIENIKDLRYVNRVNSVSTSLVNHNLLTQYACLRTTCFRKGFKLFEYDFYSEKNVKHGLNSTEVDGLKLLREPDALVGFKNDKGKKVSLAIEVELVQKSYARIYWIYKKHLDAISVGLYDAVYFYFNNERLMGLYRKYFEEPMWPVSTESNSKYFIGKNPMYIDMKSYPELDKRFVFELIDKDLLKNQLNH